MMKFPKYFFQLRREAVSHKLVFSLTDVQLMKFFYDTDCCERSAAVFSLSLFLQLEKQRKMKEHFLDVWAKKAAPSFTYHRRHHRNRRLLFASID